MSVAIVFDRFGPYHAARIGAAARLLPVVGIEIAGHSREYAWSRLKDVDFERVTLFSQRDSSSVSTNDLARRLGSALERIRPRAVAVPGWSSRAALTALQWCVRTGTPSLLMSESCAWDEERTRAAEWIKQKIVSCGSAALVGGKPHADYVVQLGLRADRVYSGYDAVDNEYFAGASDAARKLAPELRRRHRLPERFFLASARFVAKKNLPRLFEAYGEYRRLWLQESGGAPAWSLVLLGDGPLRGELVALAAQLNISDDVYLPGFQQNDELPTYYGLASAFIHASTTEQWGLVVNEAMASGLPAIVSNRCGCAEDLVQPPRNGFTFDPGHSAQLARLMHRMASLPDEARIEMGLAGREIIASWGPDRFAKNLQAAAAKAAEVGPRGAGLLQRILLWSVLHRPAVTPRSS